MRTLAKKHYCEVVLSNESGTDLDGSSNEEKVYVVVLLDRVDKGFIATVIVYELAVPYTTLICGKGNGLIFPCLLYYVLKLVTMKVHTDTRTKAGQSYRLC